MTEILETLQPWITWKSVNIRNLRSPKGWLIHGWKSQGIFHKDESFSFGMWHRTMSCFPRLKLLVETCWNRAQSHAGQQYRHSTLMSPTSLATSVIPPTHDAPFVNRPASRRSVRTPVLLQVQPLAPCWIYTCHGRCDSNIANIGQFRYWWNYQRINDIQGKGTCILSHVNVHQTV